MEPLPQSPSTAETHISWLFFTDERAYKMLKPVTMPFLDHAEPAQRLASITREYELNRAISPDVYLGTSDIVEDGEVVDRMLVMRRLPEERRLSALVDDARFRFSLRAVARTIAALHESRPPALHAPSAQLETLEANWEENLETMRPFVGSVLPLSLIHI